MALARCKHGKRSDQCPVESCQTVKAPKPNLTLWNATSPRAAAQIRAARERKVGEVRYYCDEGHPATATSQCPVCQDECLAQCGNTDCRHQQSLRRRLMRGAR